MSENKVPCGGFRIGDGLTMDGNTLKSLGGAYVKVNGDGGEIMDDSPLKTFEEIRQKGETSPVTLLVFFSDPDDILSLFYEGVNSDGLIHFYGLSIFENTLVEIRVSIDSDNKTTLSRSAYTLTPAT